MSGIRPTKTTLQQRARGLIAGTQKHLSNETLSFNGATFEPTALTQLFQQLIDALVRADAVKANWKDALKAMKDAKAAVVPTLGAYQSYVVNRFGNAPSTLEDFGIAPCKVRAPLTAEQKALAVAKRKATRAIRHTLGPKQKKNVKGTLPANTPNTGAPQTSTPTTPSTATTPAAPAPKPAS
jgi:hypothetical protein